MSRIRMNQTINGCKTICYTMCVGVLCKHTIMSFLYVGEEEGEEGTVCRIK